MLDLQERPEVSWAQLVRYAIAELAPELSQVVNVVFLSTGSELREAIPLVSVEYRADSDALLIAHASNYLEHIDRQSYREQVT